MRRADHASIFVLIAGTYTPLALLGLASEQGNGLLAAVWCGALLGVLKSLLWQKARAGLGDDALMLVFAGGVVYTIGAICYALKRPVLWPSLFGYHEAFHACTLGGAALHFAAVLQVIHQVRR